MVRPKSLAASAAVMAALATAVPAANARAATTAAATRTAPTARVIATGPGSLPCVLLLNQMVLATRLGYYRLANSISVVFYSLNCGVGGGP